MRYEEDPRPELDASGRETLHQLLQEYRRDELTHRELMDALEALFEFGAQQPLLLE